MPQLTTLHLYNNNIGDKGAKALATALQQPGALPQLTWLYLGNNNINDQLLQEIATLVRAQPQRAALRKQQELAQEQGALALKQAEELRIEQEKAKAKAKAEAEAAEAAAAKEAERVAAEEDAKNATLKQVFELISEGESRIRETEAEGILILGNTGAGKSTLAAMLANHIMQAHFDENEGEWCIDATNMKWGFSGNGTDNASGASAGSGVGSITEVPDAEIPKIGHNYFSETKIPNKLKVGNVAIWDCPGFSDSAGAVQEIANSFYIRRLFDNTGKLKFVLTITEASLKNKKGSDLIEIIEHFAKMLTNPEAVKDSMALVVTQVDPAKTALNIQTVIDKIITQNQTLNDPAKAPIKKLIEHLKASLHIFHKPAISSGTITSELKISDFNSLKFFNTLSKAKAEEASAAAAGALDDHSGLSLIATGNNVAILAKYKDTAEWLLRQVCRNIEKLKGVIVGSLTEAEQSEHSFESAYSAAAAASSPPQSKPNHPKYNPHETLLKDNGSPNIFSANYSFVKALLPSFSAGQNNHNQSPEYPNIRAQKYFAKLGQLSALKERLKPGSQDLSTDLETLSQVLQILKAVNDPSISYTSDYYDSIGMNRNAIVSNLESKSDSIATAEADYTGDNNDDSPGADAVIVPLNKQITDYTHVLKQQIAYMRFFEDLCKVEKPINPLAETVATCRKLVDDLFHSTIHSIEPEGQYGHHDHSQASIKDYYLQTIKWLDRCPDQEEQKIKEIKAVSHYTLGLIYESEGDIKHALERYIKAIGQNQKLQDAYGKVGDLFFNHGKEREAVKYYKVVNNSVKVSACFKKLIAKDPTNPDIYTEKGDYFLKTGRLDKALGCLNNALGFTKNTEKQQEICLKIATAPQIAAQNLARYADKAQTCEFYSWHSVIPEQLQQDSQVHLGGEEAAYLH